MRMTAIRAVVASTTRPVWGAGSLDACVIGVNKTAAIRAVRAYTSSAICCAWLAISGCLAQFAGIVSSTVGRATGAATSHNAPGVMANTGITVGRSYYASS